MARSSSSAAATKADFASLASVNPMCLSHWTSPVGLTLSVAQMWLASWGHHYSHQPRGAQTSHSSPLLLFSHIRLFVTPWTAAQQAYLSFPIPWVYANSCPLSRWCHPTISFSVVPFFSCPQSFPASESFQMSALYIWWPKYWSFSFSISPSNEHPGLISFRIDWFDLLAVQGTLKSLVQHHSLKASILQYSAFLFASSHVCTWLEKS